MVNDPEFEIKSALSKKLREEKRNSKNWIERYFWINNPVRHPEYEAMRARAEKQRAKEDK